MSGQRPTQPDGAGIAAAFASAGSDFGTADKSVSRFIHYFIRGPDWTPRAPVPPSESSKFAAAVENCSLFEPAGRYSQRLTLKTRSEVNYDLST